MRQLPNSRSRKAVTPRVPNNRVSRANTRRTRIRVAGPTIVARAAIGMGAAAVVAVATAMRRAAKPVAPAMIHTRSQPRRRTTRRRPTSNDANRRGRRVRIARKAGVAETSNAVAATEEAANIGSVVTLSIMKAAVTMDRGATAANVPTVTMPGGRVMVGRNPVVDTPRRIAVGNADAAVSRAVRARVAAAVMDREAAIPAVSHA